MSRGKGRGRGQGMTFNLESIGFGRGDALPTSLLQPAPTYPPQKKRPVSLPVGKDQDYLRSLEVEFEKNMKNSPYYIKEEEAKNHVERYSDKYKMSSFSNNTLGWAPNWSRFPAELRIDVRKKRKVVKRVAPNISKQMKKKSSVEDGEMVKKLEELEKKDSETTESEATKTGVKKSNEETKGSENESELEEFDDGEDEEENDYLTSYFDNGESYLDEEEENLDEKDGGIY